MGREESTLDWQRVAAQSNRIRAMALRGEPDALESLRMETATLQAMLAEFDHLHRIAGR